MSTQHAAAEIMASGRHPGRPKVSGPTEREICFPYWRMRTAAGSFHKNSGVTTGRTPPCAEAASSGVEGTLVLSGTSFFRSGVSGISCMSQMRLACHSALAPASTTACSKQSASD